MNIQKEVSDMLGLPLAQLRARYVEVIGEAPRTRNRIQLVRRIAWRLQAREQGDLSERAKRRAEELATTTDFRLSPPAPPPHKGTETGVVPLAGIEPRRNASASARGGGAMGVGPNGIPVQGASLNRTYKGKHIQVTVLAQGFEYLGARYASLSAVAKAVTGAHWNGRLFFGLKPLRRAGAST